MLKATVTADLLARYDRPGPRYTSYPTAPVWSETFGAADYAARLAAAGKRVDAPLSLYVHIPYCTSLCWYCACSVVITQDKAKGERYVDDVLAEAALVRRHLGAARPVVQHHWGGGTPTFLSPAALRRLGTGLAALFPLRRDAEVSIEVDPRVTTRAHLEALAEVGVNRISMGVQDFDADVQRAIHREQSLEQTRAVFDTARALRFQSVNVDLIYGLPGQTPSRFQDSLAIVERLRPDRIACYSYAHVPWLKPHQRLIDEAALPQGGGKLALYLTALQFLQAHGYEPIGMDHFARADDELALAARAGRLHRNFMGYTVMPADDMLAFGVTAIGEVDGAFTQNVKDVAAWRQAIAAGTLPVHRGHGRTADDEARRRIVLDLMCRFRVRYRDHGGAAAFGSCYADELQRLQPLADDGLCCLGADGITVTPTGRLLVRNLCMVFDAYLPRGSGSGTGRFSRTV